MTAAGADIIGANCGQGIAGYVPVCQRLRQGTDRPIWIKANAGLPEMVDGRATYKTTPEEFAGYLPALLAAGAGFIGGCCGTSPDFIRAVKGPPMNSRERVEAMLAGQPVDHLALMPITMMFAADTLSA